MSAWAALHRRGHAWLGRPQWHEVGGVLLELPAEHLLPAYQAAHPLYDRFLPHLTALLASGDAVLDIGANVGDSLAAMLAGQGALQVLAVEPDEAFFACLGRNAERLRARHPQARLTLVQALVGRDAQPMVLLGDAGTRHAVPAPEGAQAVQHPRRLDALLAEAPASFSSRLRLIKCDVDGQDAEVLASGEACIARRRPLLFFECQAADAARRDALLAVVARLFEAGYAAAQAFDNFGCALPGAVDLPALARLLDAVLEQDAGRAPRTMHYIDLLLGTPADAALMRSAVAAHMQAIDQSPR